MSNEVVSLLPNPNKPYYNDNEVYNGYYVNIRLFSKVLQVIGMLKQEH